MLTALTDLSPNPFPRSPKANATTQWMTPHNGVPTAQHTTDLFILLTHWGLTMRTRTITFRIAFRTTLLTGCEWFNYFLQLTPLLELEKVFGSRLTGRETFPFVSKKTSMKTYIYPYTHTIPYIFVHRSLFRSSFCFSQGPASTPGMFFCRPCSTGVLNVGSPCECFMIWCFLVLSDFRMSF